MPTLAVVLCLLLSLTALGPLPVPPAPVPTLSPPVGGAAPIVPLPSVGDWPTYLSNPERTGANWNESVLAPSNASQLRPLWNASLPGTLQGTPVVANGTVYVTSWDGNLSAYWLTNGSLRWRTFIGTSTFPLCNYAAPRGPTSTPTVVGSTVYVLGGAPQFYALSATNGSLLWNVSVAVNSPSAGDYNWGSPLVYGSSAYYGLASACGTPGAQGVVEQVNLNGSTHRVEHTFAVVPSGTLLGGVWSTPAIDPGAGVVWVTTGDGSVGTSYGQSVVALSSSDLGLVGSWQLSVSCCDYDFGAGPTLFHDGSGRALVGALNKNGVFYALNRSAVGTTGWGPAWSTNISWYANTSRGQAAGPYDLAPAAFDGATLYVGGGFARLSNGTNVSGTLRALDPSNGTLRWTQATRGLVRAGVAWADGLVVDAAILPNGSTSSLEVRNATDGSLLDRFIVPGSINGAPSVAHGVVLFGSGASDLAGAGTLWALSLPVAAAVRPFPSSIAAGQSVNLDAHATGGLPPYTFAWQFGDGSTGSTAAAPSHRFPPGNFTVSVTVSDATGATAASSAAISVAAVPVRILLFAAVPGSVAIGGSVEILGVATGGAGSLSLHYAGLPPGCPGVNASQWSCSPTAAGNYSLELLAQDPYGENATATANLTVQTGPPPPLTIASFTIAPPTLTLGETANLTVQMGPGSVASAVTYSGLPSGCASASALSLVCTPTVPGSFEVTAVVQGPGGTSAQASASLTVLPPPTPPVLRITAFVAVPTEPRVGDSLSWVAVVQGGALPYTYRYSGLPAGCPAPEADAGSCVLTAAGTLVVTLNVTDAAGTSVSDTVAWSVLSAPATAASGPNPSWPLLGAAAAAAFIAGAAAVLVGLRRRGRSPPAAPRA